MALPLKLEWPLAQTKWSSEINPVLANPLNNASILKNVVLVSGVNVINHKIGNVQQGWFIVDIQGPAVIYRSASFNDLTLTLTSNAAVTVSLGVF